MKKALSVLAGVLIVVGLGVFLQSRGVDLNFSLLLKVLKGALFFIGIVFPIVIVHEFGHFIVGKYLGAEPTEFSVGFGPKLWSKTYQGTEFKVCLYPLGGYVKFNRTQLDSEEGHEQKKLHPLRWIPIILAGPVINFIMAFAIFTGTAFIALGIPQLSEVTADSTHVDLKKGEVIAIMTDQSKIAKFVRESVLALPSDNQLFVFNYDKISAEPISGDVKYLKDSVEMTEFQTMDFVKRTKLATKIGSVLFLYMWTHTIDSFKTFKKENLSGPIGISKAAVEAQEKGIFDLVMIMGSISFALGFMNLLPLPVLDGGRALIAVFQCVYPRDMPKMVLEILFGVSLLLILALFLISTFSDLMRI